MQTQHTLKWKNKINLFARSDFQETDKGIWWETLNQCCYYYCAFTLRYKWGSRFNDNNLKTVQKVDYLSCLASLLQVSPCLHLSVRWSMGGADSRSSTTPLITERWTHLSSPSPWHQALLGAVIYQQNVNHNVLSDEKLKGRKKRWTQFDWLHAKNILVTVSSTKIAIRNLIPQRIKAQTRILWTLPSCTVCINIRTTVITERTIRLTFSSWKGWDHSVLSLHVLPVHQ